MTTEKPTDDSSVKSREEGSVVAVDESVDTQCGVGGCKPRWLQKLATIQAFVGFNAVANLFTYAVRIFLVSQITTIEKRFGFSSTQAGLILSSSQITFVISILFFSHYGRHSHIPRILSVTSSIAGVTGLVFAAAQLIPYANETLSFDAASANTTTPGNATARGICQRTEGPAILPEPNCDSDSSNYSGSSVAMGIFLAAMLIQGVVTSPRTPLSGTYVDDNNPVPTASGKYVGIMLGIFTLAPAVSFGFGALSSGIYHTLEETDLTPRDPQWIGAWWLGFIVLGILSTMFSLTVFFFPKRLRSAPPRKQPVKENNKADTEFNSNWKDIVKRLLGPLLGVFRILRLPVFTLLVLMNTMHTFALLGMASFVPKYMESQFYIPAYKANLMLAVISLLGSTVGPIVGGFVTSHFKLLTRGNLNMVLGVSIALTIGCPIAMLLAGEQTHLETSTFDVSSSTNQSCVSHCFCTSSAMSPVCGADKVTYYSPCHAGCFSGSRPIYSDCGCSNGTAVSGFCAPEDPQVYPFLLYATLNSFAVTFAASPSFMVIVRTVQEKDKALALGLSSFISTLLGQFPAPVVYGAIVDTACSMWQTSCSSRGACALYDLSSFRFKIFGTNMGLFFFSAVFIFIAKLIHSRKRSDKENYSVSNLTQSSNLSINFKEPVLTSVETTETRY